LTALGIELFSKDPLRNRKEGDEIEEIIEEDKKVGTEDVRK
jgi:hypothetical protein